MSNALSDVSIVSTKKLILFSRLVEISATFRDGKRWELRPTTATFLPLPLCQAQRSKKTNMF